MMPWFLGASIIMLLIVCIVCGPLASEQGEAEDRAHGYVPLYKRMQMNKKEIEDRDRGNK